MGIWIRSQEKETLADIVSMYVDEDNNICGYDKCSNNADNYYKLGNYSSKEKAIKVLDMIQNQMAKAVEAKTKYLPYSKGSEWSSCEHVSKVVFNMPLDDEVKV